MSEATRRRLLQQLAPLPDAARRVDGYYEPVCAWIAGLARAPSPRPVSAQLAFAFTGAEL